MIGRPSTVNSVDRERTQLPTNLIGICDKATGRCRRSVGRSGSAAGRALDSGRYGASDPPDRVALKGRYGVEAGHGREPKGVNGGAGMTVGRPLVECEPLEPRRMRIWFSLLESVHGPDLTVVDSPLHIFNTAIVFSCC